MSTAAEAFPLDHLAAQVVLRPACELAEASPEYARAALGAGVEAAKRLSDHHG